MSSSSLTSHRILQSRPQTLRYHLTRPRQQWQSTKKPTPPNITPELGSPAPQTLSARMKRLSKEYGWSALGVYLALSAIDFPFCYLAVRWLGAERIGRYETAVMGSLWHLVEIPFPNIRQARDGQNDEAREAMPVVKKDNASVWTQLALAYAVHKSLIFFRVPLTAAVTPRVVKTLRGWGWDIAKRKAPTSLP